MTDREPGSAARFFGLTLAASWVLWTPLMVWLWRAERLGRVAPGSPLEGIPTWVALLWFVGSWAPSLVALALARRAGGRAAVGRLLRRLVAIRAGTRWNAAAWLGPVLIGLIAVGALAAAGEGPTFSARRMALIPVALALAIPFGPLGEELGWRGCALPRLLARRGALASACIIGVVWTFWHLPLFWAPAGTSISGAPVTIPAVLRYLVDVTSVSILMTWLYLRTSGSLWIAVGFHAAWNAGAHRFFFEPFTDGYAADVDRMITAVLAASAAIVATSWMRRPSAG